MSSGVLGRVASATNPPGTFFQDMALVKQLEQLGPPPKIVLSSWLRTGAPYSFLSKESRP